MLLQDLSGQYTVPLKFAFVGLLHECFMKKKKVRRYMELNIFPCFIFFFFFQNNLDKENHITSITNLCFWEDTKLSLSLRMLLYFNI